LNGVWTNEHGVGQAILVASRVSTYSANIASFDTKLCCGFNDRLQSVPQINYLPTSFPIVTMTHHMQRGSCSVRKKPYRKRKLKPVCGRALVPDYFSKMNVWFSGDVRSLSSQSQGRVCVYSTVRNRFDMISRVCNSNPRMCKPSRNTLIKVDCQTARVGAQAVHFDSLPKLGGI